MDVQSKMKDDGEFRGVMIDPLDVDAHLPEPINVRQIGKRGKLSISTPELGAVINDHSETCTLDSGPNNNTGPDHPQM